jgi:hypothetical protein
MARSPRRPSRRSILPAAVGAVVLVVALAAGGCATETSRPESLARLVVLAGGDGGAQLLAYDAAGRSRTLPLPGPATSWISVSSRGDAVATLSDGSLHVAEAIGSDKPGRWVAKRPSATEGGSLDGPFWLPTWSPDAGRFAAVSTSFDTTSSRVVVYAPSTDGTLVLPVEGQLDPNPPVWLDGDRVGIARGGPDGSSLAVVDTRTGETSSISRPFGAIDVAAAASRVAARTADGGAIELFTLDGWQNGAAPDATIRLGTFSPNQFALDRRGERLALVGSAGTNRPQIVVYAAADRWREVARVDAPAGTSLAQVDWLP